MDKLLHTSLFRAILKSLNRKVVSEKRLQTYFLKFARLITALCDDTDCLSNLSAWKKSCYIIVLNTRDLSYLNLHLLHRSIGPNTILRSAFRKSFADSIG